MKRSILDLLRPVQSGQLLADVLTAARINAIQEAILNLYAGGNLGSGSNVRLRKTPGGVIVSADFPDQAQGSSEAPYILGSTVKGSSGAGTGSPVFWGGYVDRNTLTPDQPFTDTWHRDRRPKIPGSASASTDADSDSVMLDLLRFYIVNNYASGTDIEYAFTRKALFDSRNVLVSITGEVLESLEYASGHGTAEGGIL